MTFNPDQLGDAETRATVADAAGHLRAGSRAGRTRHDGARPAGLNRESRIVLRPLAVQRRPDPGDTQLKAQPCEPRGPMGHLPEIGRSHAAA